MAAPPPSSSSFILLIICYRSRMNIPFNIRIRIDRVNRTVLLELIFQTGLIRQFTTLDPDRGTPIQRPFHLLPLLIL